MSTPAIPIQIQYYAALREQRGRSSEVLETPARSPLELYESLQREHGFALSPKVLRVVINDEFADWHTALNAGDVVVFIPPVAGG